MKPIEEIISSLRIAMTDARQSESDFESWMILNEAIFDAIEALAEQPAQQEPLAWYRYETVYEYRNQLARCTKDCIGAFPVYTSPQRKPWVELDHDDIHALMNEFFYRGMQPSGAHFANFARAIEAKLKEKNA